MDRSSIAVSGELMFQWLKDLWHREVVVSYRLPPESSIVECDFCHDAPATHMAMQFPSCDYCVAPSAEGIERMKYLKEKYGG